MVGKVYLCSSKQIKKDSGNATELIRYNGCLWIRWFLAWNAR